MNAQATRRRRWANTLPLALLASMTCACTGTEQRLEQHLSELGEVVVQRSKEPRAMRALRIQKAFRPALGDELAIDGDFISPGRYKNAQVFSALTILPGQPIRALKLTKLKVELSAEEDFALASGEVQISETDQQALHATHIRFDVHLRRLGGRFIISRAWFGAPTVNVPEARP